MMHKVVGWYFAGIVAKYGILWHREPDDRFHHVELVCPDVNGCAPRNILDVFHLLMAYIRISLFWQNTAFSGTGGLIIDFIT